MDHVASIVAFLGRACGENCEVVLQDVREGKNCIIAIANGHISGREEGSPLTDLALRFLARETWKTRDCVCNYEGKTMDGRTLSSSTWFIKDETGLLGMLCINIDTTRYVRISESVLRLAGLEPGPIRRIPEPQTENFYKNMEEIIDSVLAESGGKKKAGRIPLEKKISIVGQLIERGVFLLRGSISAAAERLACSEASVYRYIGMANRRKGAGASGGLDHPERELRAPWPGDE